MATADPPPWVYQRWSDQLRVSVGLWPACGDELSPRCFEPMPPQRFKGVWLDILDASDCFLPGHSELPAELPDEECIMLANSGGRLPTVNDLDAEDYPLSRRVALIEIVGRRTRFPIGAPGVGGSIYAGDQIPRHEIVVDRVLSFQVLREVRRD